MAQQGWSFDEPTPASFWDTYSGVSLISGPHGNAAQAGILDSLIKNTVASWSSTDAWLGFRAKVPFAHLEFVRMGDLSATVLALILESNSDGRMRMHATSFLGGTSEVVPIFADFKQDEWFFIELAATSITVTSRDNGNGTHNISVSFDYSMFVNGVLVATSSYAASNAAFPDGNIPGAIGFFALRFQGRVLLDDIYAADHQIGDCIVNYDSGLADNVVVFTPPTETRMTQQLLEYHEADIAEVRITQMLVEVLLAYGTRVGLAGHNLSAGVSGGLGRVGISL